MDGVILGVATIRPGSSASLDWLLHQADEALYRAKRLGRNRVETAGETVPAKAVSGGA